ncbi:unnamed protein product [Allacma fusca]|uniref:BTB domain-containing protein n=1 Tax=Allacma fusca TaxID=39272 RepID=A0A8J2NLV3_9HEXA|nr:unnamed protein product [Allacma fusca]
MKDDVEFLQRRHSVIEKYFMESQGDPKNVTLLVGPNGNSKQFVLSRKLLQISSEEFQRILKLEEETLPGIILIPDVLPQQFEIIVQYICNSIPKELTFPNLLDPLGMLEAGRKFELEELQLNASTYYYKNICNGVMKFDAGTACVGFSVKPSPIPEINRQICNLRSAAKSFILRNGSFVLKTNSFSNLAQAKAAIILGNEQLVVESELEVFKALLRWGINNLKKEEKKCTSSNMYICLGDILVKLIRFNEMEPFEIQNYVLPTEILTDREVNKLSQYWASLISKNKTSRRKYLGHANRSWQTKVAAGKFIEAHFSDCERYNAELEIKQKTGEVNQGLKVMACPATGIFPMVRNTFHESGTKPELKRKGEYGEELKTSRKQPRESLLGKQFDLFLAVQHLKILELKAFEGTEQTACAVFIKNETSFPLSDPSNDRIWNHSRQYLAMPGIIPSKSTGSFGFTSKRITAGIVAFRLRDIALIIRYNVGGDYLDCCAVGLTTAKFNLDHDLYTRLSSSKTWLNMSDRKKVCLKGALRDQTLKFGNILTRVKMTVTDCKALIIIWIGGR